MNNVAKLPTGDTVEVVTTSKKDVVIYIFKNSEGNKIGQYTSNIPASLGNTSAVATQIKQSIDPNREYKPQNLNKRVQEIKELLQIYYENQLFEMEQKTAMELQEQEMKHNELLDHAKNKLQSLQQPLIWIGSLVDWITAGERNNILYAFLVYSGQVILNNPVSVVCLGEAGSGKSHIQESALRMIPSDYVVNEKKITEAALFNRAKNDIRFYDGKIVNYGDMGGSNDHEFMNESKNLMKELQSDGYLNKPLSVLDDTGNWTVHDLELIGRPALTYTTVPNHDFDEQEMSRSIFITPRMDNQKIFNRRNSILEFTHGKTYAKLKKYENELDMVKCMVMHLKDIFQNVHIINPHVDIVIDFLKQSSFYKRDFDKFNGLLKTITAWNYYTHEIMELDGQKVIFTTIADVQLFFTLLKPYFESITANISPKAVDVLNDFRNHHQQWRENGNNESIGGITTTEYFERQSLGLSKTSAKKYFYELHDKGFLKVVDRVGRANVYDLNDSDFVAINDNLANIPDSVYENISEELGQEVADTVKSDVFIEGLDIMNFDDGVDKPRWLQ